MVILVIAIVLIVLLYLVLALNLPAAKHRKGGPKPAQGKVKSPRARHRKKAMPWRAISASCGASACEAAQSIEGRRFLLSEAPQIPLPDCDARRCHCKYAHHEDRREAGRDRRLPNPLSTQLYTRSGESERREHTGRRESDWVVEQPLAF